MQSRSGQTEAKRRGAPPKWTAEVAEVDAEVRAEVRAEVAEGDGPKWTDGMSGAIPR